MVTSRQLKKLEEAFRPYDKDRVVIIDSRLVDDVEEEANKARERGAETIIIDDIGAGASDKAKLDRIERKITGGIDPEEWEVNIFIHDPKEHPDTVKEIHGDREMTAEEWSKKVEKEEDDPNKFNLLIGVARSEDECRS